MKFSFIKTIASLSLLIFIFFILNYFYIGINSLPTEGDSISFHIPAAKAILNGTIMIPETVSLTNYPVSSETILALLIFLHIPVNIYNVFAVCLLFIALYFLGRKYSFSRNFAIIFATTLSTLYGIIRYINTQKIDIWLLLFFTLSLTLLQKPKKTIMYFFFLGLTLGMVVGSKYSGPFFVAILILIYLKDLLKILTFKRFFAFFLPFTATGLSWYIRNIINTGSPFYPQGFLFFQGDPSSHWVTWHYWDVAIQYSTYMINALISEFMLWSIFIIIFPLILLYLKFKKKIKFEQKKLILLFFATITLFLWLPPPPLHSYTSVVFGIRYGFPVILTLILLLFLLAKKYKKEDLISSISLANISFLLLPIPYHPKFIFLYVPIISFLLLTIGKILKKHSVLQ